jgi:tetratricopeptide (TPR) repeat protein
MGILRDLVGEVAGNLLDGVINVATNCNNAGVVKAKAGDYTGAIEEYTKAITLKSKEAVYFYNRGSAYYSLKNWQYAITDFTKAITLKPKEAVYFYDRGLAYCSLKEWQHAITDFTEAIRLNPQNSGCFNSRGNAFFSLKDWNHAIADYSEAIKLNPKDHVLFSNRAGAYRQLNDFQHTIADYDEAIKLNPQEAMYFNNRGLAYGYGLNDWTHAMADHAEAVRLSPDNKEYKQRLAIAEKEAQPIQETEMNLQIGLYVVRKHITGGENSSYSAAETARINFGYEKSANRFNINADIASWLINNAPSTSGESYGIFLIEDTDTNDPGMIVLEHRAYSGDYGLGFVQYIPGQCFRGLIYKK